MNTPAHLIIGLSAFGKNDLPRVSFAALAGAIMPDLSLYVLAGVSIYWLALPAQYVFDELYFSDAWQAVFAADNSFILWGVLFGIASWRRHPVLIAFSGAALLHLALDFPFHHDDARRHFWPVSDWVFNSPVSYWDPRHHGGVVGAFEVGLALGLCVILLRRFTRIGARLGIAVLGIAEVSPVLIWYLMFSA